MVVESGDAMVKAEVHKLLQVLYIYITVITLSYIYNK